LILLTGRSKAEDGDNNDQTVNMQTKICKNVKKENNKKGGEFVLRLFY
jgi:hypothetical protein